MGVERTRFGAIMFQRILILLPSMNTKNQRPFNHMVTARKRENMQEKSGNQLLSLVHEVHNKSRGIEGLYTSGYITV